MFFPSEGAIEHCGNKTCQFGAKCKHDPRESTLKCSCDFYCDQKSSQPVCGSDGKTYPSECSLQQRGCENQLHILITDFAPCKCKFIYKCLFRNILEFKSIFYKQKVPRSLKSKPTGNEGTSVNKF